MKALCISNVLNGTLVMKEAESRVICYPILQVFSSFLNQTHLFESKMNLNPTNNMQKYSMLLVQ